MSSFFAELQRRHVYKVGAMYAVAGWLLVQVVTQVLPVFDVSPLAQRIIVLVIVAGFPLALVLAWIFDITPQGIVRTSSEPAAQAAAVAAAHPGRERLLNYLLGALLLLAGAYLVAERLWLPPAGATAAKAPIDDKSVAVLPFENLSDDKANAYFAEGIQDEILTKLAKIGALRVIARSSTQQYAAQPANVAEIARQLGVAHILEGSVQKAGDAVHINVQLIRAASGDHLWAETYDRKLDNVFGVESEVAQAIAQALQAQLSGGEQQLVEARPTDNAAAYDAYLRGLGEEGRAITGQVGEPVQAAERSYAEAVRLDPAFALAWAHLSIIRSYMYFNLVSRTPELLEQARQAADTAQKLRPEMGEGFLAQGYYRYWGLLDFSGGLAYFQQALQRLPNNSDVLAAIGYIERRQGKWQESTQHLEQATRLDPLNIGKLSGLATNYFSLRQFPQALAVYDRALAAVPQDPELIADKIFVYQRMGDLDAADKLLEPLSSSLDIQKVFQAKMMQLWLRRRYQDGIELLSSQSDKVADGPISGDTVQYDFRLGFFHIWAGHPEAAHAPCARALDSLNRMRKSDADDVQLADLYSATYICLGDYPAALRYAKMAVELNANDSVNRVNEEITLILSQAWSGDHDSAIAALPRLLQEPGGLTVADLRLVPFWDVLRKDPRFQALLGGS